MAGLPLRRAGLHLAQPYSQISLSLAGFRRNIAAIAGFMDKNQQWAYA